MMTESTGPHSSKALDTPLPGEGNAGQQRNEPADDVVESLLADLKQLRQSALLEFALRVGELVVERLFHGDIPEVQRRGPKPVALRRLAERPDLPIRVHELYRSVALYDLSRRLPSSLLYSPHLSRSHFERALAAPRDAQVELLERAMRERLSVRELSTTIERGARKGRGGRPRLPLPVKAARSVRREVERLSDVMADESAFALLESEEYRELHRVAVALRGAVEEIIQKLAEVRAAVSSSRALDL